MKDEPQILRFGQRKYSMSPAQKCTQIINTYGDYAS